MQRFVAILFSVCLQPFAFAAVDTTGTSISPGMTQTARALIARAKGDDRAYNIVKSLTTEVGPRLAGTVQEARARDWAVKQLKQLGFANVAIEPFEVPLWTRGVEVASIVEPFPQALRIATLGGSASTGPEGVEASVIAFASLAELEAASPDEVAGKIVFVDEVMARSRDGSGYFIAVAKRRGTAYAAERLGAVAALIRSVGTSTHRFAHTGQMKSVDYSAPNKGVPTAALTAPDADQLRRALAYGKPVTVKMVVTPTLHPPSASGNVVAEIVGREAPDEIVIVGAHLDSWDLGTGAIDDGAGVGIVVAAAALLKEQFPQGLRRTVRIVLFGSEEVGVVGARAYAQRHAEELDKHIVGTESDFGAGDILQFDTRFGESKLTAADLIAALLQPLGIERGGNEAYGGPDMRYLREAGVPMVTLRQNGTDYFDLHHTANDTLDKIAPRALDQNVAAYSVFLYLAAEMQVDFR